MWRIVRYNRRSVTSFLPARGSNVEALLLSTSSQRSVKQTSHRTRTVHTTTPRCLDSAGTAQPELISREVDDGTPLTSEPRSVKFAKELPVVCPGCGALSQTVERDVPGYYGQRARRELKRDTRKDESRIFEEAMARLAGTECSLGPTAIAATSNREHSAPARVPICDRCHYLTHQSQGNPIVHPSMQSIQSIIESSPHRRNHIYHVLDAADFPMSLIPNLMSALHLPRLRTQNRRSKSMQYIRGRIAEVTFIITRSDLLAPKKEQVDRMMSYLQEVLRDALGRTGRNVRLGNIRCVSAKRGWWTPDVKQAIWDKGGAGWFVGKVNVGKSALFEAVFPKGRNSAARISREGQPAETLYTRSAGEESSDDLDEAESPTTASSSLRDLEANYEEAASRFERGQFDPSAEHDLRQREISPEHDTTENEENDRTPFFDEDEDGPLLPPAQPETAYPQMPIVSSLPGTTASPIRIPFGNGKGELVDLPGVERSTLETHVLDEHRSSLIMSKRIVPEQQSINPGQSLLLGGMIRITPTTPDVQFLGYGFVPLAAHTTNTAKAIAIQTGVAEDGLPYAGNVSSMLTEAAKQKIQSAGKFKLQWDVTKVRAGPLTDKTAGKQKVQNLPFIVYSADILIEGVGWVELTCQVRRFGRNKPIGDWGPVDDDPAHDSTFPEVEVFSPEGKYISIRRPMNAWLIGGPKKVAKHAQRSRPRMTISMKRRQEGGRLGSQRSVE